MTGLPFLALTYRCLALKRLIPVLPGTTTPPSPLISIGQVFSGQRRGMVWHEGHLQEQEAQDVAEEIEAKQRRLQQQQGEKVVQVNAQKAELDALRAKYQQLTGELYEQRQDHRHTHKDTHES